MSDSPRQLTRNQLSEFLPNARAVRAFEQVLQQVGSLLPSDIATINRNIEAVGLEASRGMADAQSALAQLVAIVQDAALNNDVVGSNAMAALTELNRLSQALEMLALAPQPLADQLVLSSLIQSLDMLALAPAVDLSALLLSVTADATLTGSGTSVSPLGVSKTSPVTVSADYTVLTTDQWIINNKSSACVLTLPSASASAGRAITVQNYQAFTLSSASSNVVPQGGGAAGTAILLGVAGNWATLVSNGSNWVVMQAAPNNILLLE